MLLLRIFFLLNVTSISIMAMHGHQHQAPPSHASATMTLRRSNSTNAMLQLSHLHAPLRFTRSESDLAQEAREALNRAYYDWPGAHPNYTPINMARLEYLAAYYSPYREANGYGPDDCPR